MSSATPLPYNVVYDTDNGLRYEFATGYLAIPEASPNAITALTGAVTASGPGSATATLTNTAVTGQPLTGYTAGAGTIAATDTILQAINKIGGNAATYLPLTGGAVTGALSITGTALAGSTTSQTGVMAYLGFNGTNNRQLFLKDGAVANASAEAIRFVLNSGSPSIDVYVGDLSGPGVVPLTLGNTTNGVVIAGPLIQNVVAVAGTGTVTPTAKQATISIPVSGDVTFNGPTSGYDGQKLLIRVVNDGSHSVTLATGAGNYSFGTTITGYTNSVSLVDYIGVIWNTAAGVWHVVSLSQGF